MKSNNKMDQSILPIVFCTPAYLASVTFFWNELFSLQIYHRQCKIKDIHMILRFECVDEKGWPRYKKIPPKPVFRDNIRALHYSYKSARKNWK